jgi:hypothetical protein
LRAAGYFHVSNNTKHQQRTVLSSKVSIKVLKNQDARKMRIKTYITGLVIGANLTACGELHRDAAIAYHQAAEVALINAGKCSDSQDCTKKKMVFWAGGGNLLPWTDKAYVTVYNVSDLAAISRIKETIEKSRKSLNGPPCQLTVYSGSHSNPNKKVHDETV